MSTTSVPTAEAPMMPDPAAPGTNLPADQTVVLPSVTSTEDLPIIGSVTVAVDPTGMTTLAAQGKAVS